MKIDNIRIAHRGCHDDIIPENSLKAFEKCVLNNYPIELDVHLLNDGNIIVFHDDNLKRMTGLDKNVCDVSYNEIKYLRLNNTNQKIPLFKDVLNQINGKVLVDVELKFDQKKYLLEDKLIEELKNYKGDIILKSFRYKTVRYLKKNSKYKVGLLYPYLDNKKYGLNRLQKWIIRHINFNLILKPDFISCSKLSLNDKCIKTFKGPLLIWTIRTQQEEEKFLKQGKSVISEYNKK